ncbi:NADP-dependent malic enzyme-like [Hydractinia symbiolongicarpus]|uniref:NADP-dependent malic enzyme-like n=1 Tax=Hydractinia symbiolongicarpus TaxID=13093 RepID=UPI00254D4CC0|nr:NADP-dependent malic enzyme-like [Hydractinia symbiolongicarpus]
MNSFALPSVLQKSRWFIPQKSILRRTVATCKVFLQRTSIILDGYNRNEDVTHVNKIPTIKGFDILRNPKLNKSTAFSIAERQILGIHGLLPPAVNSQRVQMDRVMKQLRTLQTDLQRYIQLTQILARNERLFYQLLMEYTEELMPIVYTPTVGLACQQYGLIFRDPRGLFITINDLGHVYDIVSNWPERRVQAVVMTDGERILGLGDLGCNGMGIPIGKLALYTACGGIHPSACLPIMIDVGTNNEELLNDPMYIGLRQKRDNSERYDELIDEVIQALRKRFGAHVLIQYEDFGSHNSFRLLERYQNKVCTFNDDIQGTAAVALGGILASLKVNGMKLTDHKFLFLGAGGAACGIAQLLVKALIKCGLTESEACKHIWMFDKDGLLTKNRQVGEITSSNRMFAHDAEYMDDFEHAVKQLKPTALLGVAGVGQAFTKEICQQMTLNCSAPIIFALSNPTTHAECTAEQAYTWTDGKCIFASGSPFADVTLPDGKHFTPGQGNNVYIFPGLALGVIATAAHKISEEMFLTAAETLAEQVTDQNLKQGRVFPPLNNIKEVSFEIAVRVAQLAYEQGVATVMPEPKSKADLVSSLIYEPDYESYIPATFSYPDNHENH